MTSPYFAPSPTATRPSPMATPPQQPTSASSSWRVVALIFVGIIVIAVLTASLVSTASAARKIAYPTPHVGISLDATSSTHVGDVISFHAVNITGRDLTYTWDFGESGVFASGANVSYTYSSYQDAGYTVTLTAVDPIGQRTTAEQSFKLLPPMPTATFTQSTSPNDPLTVNFDATGSTGNNLTYEWDFGDGNTSQYPQPSDSYTHVGTYVVRLTVTDSSGQSATTSQQVVIQIPAPTASFVAAQTSNYSYFGEACYSFDASASSGYQLTYSWDFGDGNTEPNDTYPSTSHCYTSSGSYHVTLTVIDDVNQHANTSQDISF